jgi:hypothetical protein
MNPANAWLLLTTRSKGVELLPTGWGALRPADVMLAMKGLERPKFLIGMAALAGDRDVFHELTAYVHLFILDLAVVGEWKIKRGSEAYRRMAALVVFEILNGERCFVCHGKGTYNPPPESARSEVDDGKELESKKRLHQALRRVRRLEWRANLINEELRKGTSDPLEARVKAKRLKKILRWINAYVQITEILPEPAECEVCKGSGRLKLEGWHRAWLAGFSEAHWYRIWAGRYEPVKVAVEGWISDCLTHVRERLESRAA